MKLLGKNFSPHHIELGKRQSDDLSLDWRDTAPHSLTVERTPSTQLTAVDLTRFRSLSLRVACHDEDYSFCVILLIS